MSTTIDQSDLQQRLDEVLARAAAGERFIVRSLDGSEVVVGPSATSSDEDAPVATRRRHRSTRTVADVLAEDRGAWRSTSTPPRC